MNQSLWLTQVGAPVNPELWPVGRNALENAEASTTVPSSVDPRKRAPEDALSKGSAGTTELSGLRKGQDTVMGCPLEMPFSLFEHQAISRRLLTVYK